MAVNGRGRPTKEQAAERARVEYWNDRIAEYKQAFGGDKWEGRVEKILRKYRGNDYPAGTSNPSAKFNILWSNVQTLVPATFSRLPQPDVSRRFRDNDPVGRVASMILERGLDFEVQNYPDYRMTMSQSVHDRFLGGRATAWARYEPHMLAAQQQLPVNGVEITEDVDEPAATERLDYECAPVDYVHWKDFGHTVARTWEEVTAVWRCVYMSRAACVERFGKDKGEAIPLDSSPDEDAGGRKYSQGQNEEKNLAAVYEIWDKKDQCVEWMTRTTSKILDTKRPGDDGWMDFEGFWPCPRPLYATLTNETLVPVPDYTLYQDQANTLDILCDRIDGLCKMLQVKGVYDGSADSSLGRLFTEGENGTLMPVKNWAAFAEKNGLKGQIDVYDITPIFNALREAMIAMTQQKEQVYEITGISDIVRGQTEASETLGAQEIKRNFVGLRLGAYKEQVALYATEILRLKAQIICLKFDAQTIAKIAAVEQLAPEDQQYIRPAIELLKSEPLRNFRVDIAADTLVQMDEEKEQQSRIDFIAMVGAYLEKAITALTQAGPATPALAPMVMALLKFGVTGFKVGKSVEGAIDQAADLISKIAAQPPQPKPDPKMAEIEMKAKAEAAKLQQEGALETQRNAQEQQRADAEMRQKAQLEAMQNMMDQRFDAMTAKQDAVFKRWEAMLDAKTKIEVAKITAQASVEAAENRPEPKAAA